MALGADIIDLEIVLDLLAIADQFLVDGLKVLCENAVLKKVTVSLFLLAWFGWVVHVRAVRSIVRLCEVVRLPQVHVFVHLCLGFTSDVESG